MDKIFTLLEDREFLKSLYAFSYSRTNNTHEAEDLTSEIILRVLKSSTKNSEIQYPHAFIWTIARRTYVDYYAKRLAERNKLISLDSSDAVLNISDASFKDDFLEDSEKIKTILREITFLSKIYREVCIMYYLDDKSVSEIAKALSIKETTVKQRLFSARNTIRKGAEIMENKYPALKPVRLAFFGTGSPIGNDPGVVAERTFSQNLVYLCKDNPKNARELSEALNVPMPFVEEEIEIQLEGANRNYGLLRKTDTGKYIANFIIVDLDDYKDVSEMFKRNTDIIARRFEDYIKRNEAKLLSLPFLNKSVTLPLIAWGLISKINWWYEDEVTLKIEQKYMSDVEKTKREFFTYGVATKHGDILDIGFYGNDGIYGKDIANYKKAFISNIYGERIDKHFHCGHNISTDDMLLMMLRAIDGVSVSSFSDKEKEVAARAIEVGYVYKDNDKIYTKPLTMEKDESIIYNVVADFTKQISDLVNDCADELYCYIKKLVPAHLIGEYHIFTQMGANGLLDGLIERCIDIGILNIPNKLCAEGMLVVVE